MLFRSPAQENLNEANQPSVQENSNQVNQSPIQANLKETKQSPAQVILNEVNLASVQVNLNEIKQSPVQVNLNEANQSSAQANSEQNLPPLDVYLKYYKKIAECLPKDPIAYYQMGVIYFQQSLTKLAIKYFTKAALLINGDSEEEKIFLDLCYCQSAH